MDGTAKQRTMVLTGSDCLLTFHRVSLTHWPQIKNISKDCGWSLWGFKDSAGWALRMLPLPCRVPYHSAFVRTELWLTFMERDREWGPLGNLPWTFLWLGLHLGRDHLLWICLWRVQRSSPSLQNCYTRSRDHHRISVGRRKMALRGGRVSYSITFHSHSEFENKRNTDKLFTRI